VRSDVSDLRAQGVDPLVLDRPVGPKVLPFWVKPGADQASDVFPVFLSGVNFDTVSDEAFFLRNDGHLRRAAFEPTVGGAAQELERRGWLKVTGARVKGRPREVCVSNTGEFAAVEFLPPRVLRGREWYLHSRYRTSADGEMALEVNRGVPYPRPFDRTLPSRPAGGNVLTVLGALPAGVPTFGGFMAEVLPGRRACFERFVVGSYDSRVTK
jgi:hypothetical protein